MGMLYTCSSNDSGENYVYLHQTAKAKCTYIHHPRKRMDVSAGQHSIIGRWSSFEVAINLAGSSSGSGVALAARVGSLALCEDTGA